MAWRLLIDLEVEVARVTFMKSTMPKTDLDFINAALVGPKTSYGLQHPFVREYASTLWLCSTDGHRIHMLAATALTPGKLEGLHSKQVTIVNGTPIAIPDGLPVPDIRQVIPSGKPAATVQVETAELTDLLKCHSKVKPSRTSKTRAAVTGDDVRVVYNTRGDHLVHLDPVYLNQALIGMTAAEVQIEVFGKLDPVIVRPAGSAHRMAVIMPMRSSLA